MAGVRGCVLCFRAKVGREEETTNSAIPSVATASFFQGIPRSGLRRLHSACRYEPGSRKKFYLLRLIRGTKANES
jgi:hypothetical protein